MTVQEAVDRYYDAWQNKAGDFSEVPLAEDFEFTGPVASPQDPPVGDQRRHSRGVSSTSLVSCRPGHPAVQLSRFTRAAS